MSNGRARDSAGLTVPDALRRSASEENRLAARASDDFKMIRVRMNASDLAEQRSTANTLAANPPISNSASAVQRWTIDTQTVTRFRASEIPSVAERGTTSGTGQQTARRVVVTSQELDLMNRLIMNFGDFEFFLRPMLPAISQAVGGPLVERYLISIAMRVYRFIEQYPPSQIIKISTIVELLDLFDLYLNQIRASSAVLAVARRDLREFFQPFLADLETIRNQPGIESELDSLRSARQRESEREQQQREAEQWIQSIVPYPNNPDSRIYVGERRGTWRVSRINRRGYLFAGSITSGREIRHTFDEWYFLRTVVNVAEAPWIQFGEQSVIVQFFYGILEGLGDSVRGILESITKINETLESIAQLYSDPLAALNAFWDSIWEWFKRFGDSFGPERARQLGQLIGSLLFEIILTKGLGSVAAVRRADEVLRTLRQGSQRAARLALQRLRWETAELLRDTRGNLLLRIRHPRAVFIAPQVERRLVAQLRQMTIRRSIPLPTLAEHYIKMLVGDGHLRQLMGNVQEIIRGHLRQPPGSGKDLWAFRGDGGPLPIEVKYTGREYTRSTNNLNEINLDNDSFKRRSRFATGFQASPEGDVSDWLNWLAENRSEATDLVDRGLLDNRWLNEMWINKNGRQYFQQRGNRFVVVVSPGGMAGLTERAFGRIRLPKEQLIRVAEPGV